MSELRSIVEAFRVESLAEQADAQLEVDFTELHVAIEHLETERLRRLGEIDRRRLYERDGHLSAAAWLVRAFRVAWGAARDQVRIARSLEEMPQTRRALEAGDVSLSAARVLAFARSAEPAAFPKSEALLVDAAGRHSVTELQRVVAF
jgi:hypothetical protein